MGKKNPVVAAEEALAKADKEFTAADEAATEAGQVAATAQEVADAEGASDAHKKEAAKAAKAAEAAQGKALKAAEAHDDAADALAAVKAVADRPKHVIGAGKSLHIGSRIRGPGAGVAKSDFASGSVFDGFIESGHIVPND